MPPIAEAAPVLSIFRKHPTDFQDASQEDLPSVENFEPKGQLKTNRPQGGSWGDVKTYSLFKQIVPQSRKIGSQLSHPMWQAEWYILFGGVFSAVHFVALVIGGKLLWPYLQLTDLFGTAL